MIQATIPHLNERSLFYLRTRTFFCSQQLKVIETASRVLRCIATGAIGFSHTKCPGAQASPPAIIRDADASPMESPQATQSDVPTVGV